MALSTISPTLSETFGVLVNLAVVSNVVPYIISLSALMVMMQKAGTPQATYRRNVAVVFVALALQRLRDLRVGRERGARRHDRDGHRLRDLRLHRAALRSGAGEPAVTERGDIMQRARSGSLLAAIFLLLAARGSRRRRRWSRSARAGQIRLGYVDGGAAVLVPRREREAGGLRGGALREGRGRGEGGAEAAAAQTEFVQVGAEERFDAVKRGQGRPALRGRHADGEPAPGGVVLDPGVRWAESARSMREDAPAPDARGPRGPARAVPAALARLARARSCASGPSSSCAERRRRAWLAQKRSIEFGIDGEGRDRRRLRGRASTASLGGSADVLFGDRAILLDAARRSPPPATLMRPRPPLHVRGARARAGARRRGLPAARSIAR